MTDGGIAVTLAPADVAVAPIVSGDGVAGVVASSTTPSVLVAGRGPSGTAANRTRESIASARSLPAAFAGLVEGAREARRPPDLRVSCAEEDRT
jgi:hypothetical protein